MAFHNAKENAVPSSLELVPRGSKITQSQLRNQESRSRRDNEADHSLDISIINPPPHVGGYARHTVLKLSFSPGLLLPRHCLQAG